MSCDDLRQALPLLPGTHPDDEARVRAHAAACEACGELLRAYEGDERVLATLQQAPRPAPAILDGFTASVMARIAEEEQKKKKVALAASSAPAREAEVLRPAFGAWRLLAAAAVLLAVTLGVMSGRTPAPVVESGPDLVSSRPTGVQPVVPVVSPTTSPDPLPAPKRLDQAPMPLRRRGPIVPVGEGQRGGARGAGQGELLDAIEQLLPNLHRRMLRELGDERGEREVRF